MSDMYVYMYVCMYICMYVCMHVCTKSFLKTTTNSSCVCTHLANKADSDSDSEKEPLPSIEYIYSKLTCFPEGQQFTKNVFFFYWSYEVF